MADIKDKIAKLLALSESPNDHEAKAALLMARKLMAEYKLHPDEIKRKDRLKVIKRTIGLKCTKRTNTWAMNLASIVADHYCCKSYSVRQFDERTIELGLIGLEDDFEICEQIFKYAYDCVLSKCKAIKLEWRRRYAAEYIRKITNAYGYGFCSGLLKSFEEQKAENQEWGLIMQTPQAVLDITKFMDSGDSDIDLDFSGHKAKFVIDGYKDGQNFNPASKLQG